MPKPSFGVEGSQPLLPDWFCPLILLNVNFAFSLGVAVEQWRTQVFTVIDTDKRSEK